MVITEILITSFGFLIGYWYLTYKYYSKHLTKYPGPIPLPILGTTLYFRKFEEILPTALKFHKLYGKTCKFSVGFGSFRLSTSNTKTLEFIMSSTKLLNKGNDYKFLHGWLGNGLLTSTGDKWRKHRKMLTPAFHFQILEQFTDVFDSYSNILVENLRKEVNKKSVNIYPYITLCALDIICASSMGTSVNAQKNSESDYVRSVKEVCRIVVERSTNIIKRNDFLYKFTKDYENEQRAIQILHDYTNSVISSRTKELDNNECNPEITFDEIKKKKTLLDTLIECKKKDQTLTDEQIREEVDTFMFEGHDTTTSAISFTLYCLAQYPHIEKKVVEELRDIFGDDFHRPATYTDLQNMKYLEKVIKESLRLYPPVPMYGRSLSEDIAYNDGLLPKGVTITINAFCLHRDPDVYPNPDDFDPERFSLENQLNRSPYAYLPFSAGSRNCIGQKFAMLEVKAVISKVLKNFELLPCPEHKLILVPEVILKSSTGINIGLRGRVM